MTTTSTIMTSAWTLARKSESYEYVIATCAAREREGMTAAERMEEVDNREKLVALATAAFGSRWQTETANALGVNDRSVRAWVSGKTGVSNGVLADLRGIVQERATLLREALIMTDSEEQETGWLPILLDAGDGRATTRLLSVGGILIGTGEEGDLVRTTVRLRDPATEKIVDLPFEEEIADGVFVSLNSYHWGWNRETWIEALGSEARADVVFEAAKGLVRESHPELTTAAAEHTVRAALAERGYEIVGRDKDAHFHWHVRHEDGHEGWYASLRAAARELLPDA